MTPRQKEAFDRRRAAVHEAGHIVVAQAIGVPHLGATLFRGEPGEKLWVGEAQTMRAGIPKRKRIMVSVAGVVAEACWLMKYHWRSAEWDEEDLSSIRFWQQYAECLGMSTTDWEGTGCEPGQPTKAIPRAAAKVFDLLNPYEDRLWPNLVKSTRWLILRWAHTPIRPRWHPHRHRRAAHRGRQALPLHRHRPHREGRVRPAPCEGQYGHCGRLLGRADPGDPLHDQRGSHR